MKPYFNTINWIAEYAPSLESPTKFIEWAEEVSNIISFIYEKTYDTVTDDLTEAAKEIQDYEE